MCGIFVSKRRGYEYQAAVIGYQLWSRNGCPDYVASVAKAFRFVSLIRNLITARS